MLNRLALSITLLTLATIWPNSLHQQLDLDVPPPLVNPNGGYDGVGRTVELTATDPGAPGGPITPGADQGAPRGNGTRPTVLAPMAGLGQIQEDQWCGWASLPTVLPADDPAWGE